MARAISFDSAAPDANARARTLRRARRHTAFVRALKIALPTLSLGVVMIYGLLFARVATFAPAADPARVPKILPEHLAMQNPRYDGYTKDGGSYLFAADSAAQSLTETNLVSLTAIKGTMTDGAKVKTTLVAKEGTFDTKSNTLTMAGGIEIVSESGLKATLERATVLAKDNVITSDLPVLVELPAGTIRSKRMTIRQKLKEATFSEDVVANLKATDTPAAAPATGAGQPLFGAAGQPIEVTANRLDVNDTARTAVFSGNVKAAQGDSTIITPELTIAYESAGVASGAAPSGAPSGKLRQITASDPVALTRGANERITAAAAVFDAPADTAVLTGRVLFTALPDRKAEGDRAEFNSRANTVVLTGAVTVSQGENVLRGRRLSLDRANGRTELSSPADAAAPAGRVSARLYQKSAKGKAGPAAAPAPAKPANADGGGFAGAFKADPNAPVDIEADVLDVNDAARVATFRGRVAARQGELVIHADEMQARMSGRMGLADQGDGQPAGATEITHIDARGKVKVVSKEGQTATGDWAKVDVKANKAVLGGKVELVQGRNTVAGTRLTIDMTSGESVIGDDAKTAGATSQSRPQAVFYPKELKDKMRAAAPGAAKALETLKSGQSAEPNAGATP